jgi:hypothetical protein
MPAALRVLVLVAAHPKLQSFVQLCAWSILSLRPKPPLAHYSEFIFVTAFEDLYVSWVPKNPRKWGSWFRLGEIEPSFKDFLASSAMIHLGCCQLIPMRVVQNCSHLAIF